MAAMTYWRPTTVAEAVDMLSSPGRSAVLGGGQTLVPAQQRTPGRRLDVVDLGSVPGLTSIEVDAEAVTVGAMTTHTIVASHSGLRHRLPSLSEMVGVIADPLVRNRATIGGAVAHNDPAGDYPAACLGLRASIITDRRTIGADTFFDGPFHTVLAADEIVVAVQFPIPDGVGCARLPDPAMRSALVSVTVARFAGRHSVGVSGAAAEGVLRWTDAEQRLDAAPDDRALAGLHLAPDAAPGSTAYRRHVAAVLARRAAHEMNPATVR